MPPYRPRLLTRTLLADLATFPVVALTGSRQTGKSTLTRDDDAFAGRPWLTLDDFDVLEEAKAAPHDLLQRHPTMTLDEVQRTPPLLLAVKALVDRDRPRRPGRFLLTGSANLLLMEAVADSLAGRAGYRVLHPMTRRELAGEAAAGRWDVLFGHGVDDWPALLGDERAEPEDWRTLARHGGMPVPALELGSADARSRWFEGYARTYLERDLRQLSDVQDLPAFRRLMRASALRTGGLLNIAELGRDIGMPSATVARHLGLLETSHLIHRVEAFAVNRTTRLVKSPKLYWTDVALGLHLAESSPDGAHLENLVLMDLLAWAETHAAARPRVLHWRTASGREVDFVVEHGAKLLAIEVKATSRPTRKHARHLRAFREDYGDRVVGGLLLHDGDETYRMSDGIVATPWWRVL